MADESRLGRAFHAAPPPEWALRAQKDALQQTWDLIGAPLRMLALPDYRAEQLHLTSLRAERLRVVLPELRGRVLDVGCGDNMLLRLYRARSGSAEASKSVGVDVHQWTDDVVVIENSARLPFADNSFDTVTYIACLNHIPERADSLREAHRLLRPGGRVVVTMIGSFVGKVGHALWWYSEDKERDLHPDEVMGMDVRDVLHLVRQAGFAVTAHKRFGYGLNNLFVAEKTPA